MGKTHRTKKDKIKILGIQTHYKRKVDAGGKEHFFIGGVDYARLILPLRYLPKDEFEVKTMLEPTNIEELTKHYDIIYSSYIDTDIVYVKIKVNAIKHGCEWVMDLDDNIWNVAKTHPYYKDFTSESPKFQRQNAILKDTDYLTTTNRNLKNKMMKKLGKRFDQIKVLPNFIDLTDYDYKKIPKIDKKGIQIGYMGGSSHFDDVNKQSFISALEIIMDKHKDVIFKTTFYMPQLKAKFGHRYKYILGRANVFGFIDDVWPIMSAESDIFVAPLADSPYTKCKSYIKFLEYSAGKTPSILENIYPYKEIEGDHVLMASTTKEWVEHLDKLITDKKYRKELGERAYKYVKNNHTIQGNVGLVADYFRSVLTNSQ